MKKIKYFEQKNTIFLFGVAFLFGTWYTDDMEREIYDCIIVGGGVAAISAALTLQANGKSFLVFAAHGVSEKIGKAEKIHNYPGLADISGADFSACLERQLIEAKIPMRLEKVTGVYALKDKYEVLTSEGNAYAARTAILATGVEAVRQIAGETAFVGRGVSYCATCDGFLYKGKTIAVVCTSKALEHEVAYLAELAKIVYFIPMYKHVEIDGENIKKIVKLPFAVEGEKRVQRLRFSETIAETQSTELPVDGVFMLRECVSPSVLVGGLAVEEGHIVVTRDMETNLRGLFAAGDCTGRPYQYAKAAGEGNIAAHSVCAYLRAVHEDNGTKTVEK